jgi:hypothetical protein
MKAFKCSSVTLNHDARWVVKVVEDGGEYEMVPGSSFYVTQAECEAEMLRLDDEENGGS